MENPFELIMDKLSNIESMLKKIQQKEIASTVSTEILDITQAADYLHLSKSTLYGLTARRGLPHFKRGKRLYFKKGELNEWMTQNKVYSQEEIEKQAEEYCNRNKVRRF